MSFFSSQRSGLQGLSFFHSIWDGESNHCGYDRDCISDSSKSTRVAMNSQSSCEGNLERQFCNPNTLQYQSHGLTHGVSSFRWLVGASYFEIEQVHGDNSIWDYTAFNKIGTTWAGLNMAFFVLYDVVLVGYDALVGLHVIEWNLAKYKERRENDETQDGSGKDSRGIDCFSPDGLVNIGPSFDVQFVGPIYLSPRRQGEMEAGVQISSEPSAKWQIFSHPQFGFRIGYNDAYVVGIQLQVSGIFANQATMVPIYSKREFILLGQVKLMRVIVYARALPFARWEYLLVNGVCQCSTMIIMMLLCCRSVYLAPQKDVSGSWSDQASYCA